MKIEVYTRPHLMLVLILVCSTFAWTQPKDVDKKHIEGLEAAAEKKRSKISYRETTIQTGYRDVKQQPYSSSKSIIEIQRPDRKRFVYEETTAQGTRRSESIEIGKLEYERENGGQWTVVKKKPVDFSSALVLLGKIDESKVTTKYEYLYLGEEKIGDVVTDSYRTTTTRILTGGKREIINPSAKTVWFDKMGRLVKILVETSDNISSALHREVTEYEYDIPIKIEAPIK